MLSTGILNPNTPFKVANSFYEGQQQQRANALADYTLAAKQREDQDAQATRNALSGADFSTPDSTRAAVQTLMRVNPKAGMELQKTLDERAKSQVDQGKTKADTTKQVLATARNLLNGVGDQAAWTTWRDSTIKSLPDVAGLDAYIPTQFSPIARQSMMLEADKLMEREAPKLDIRNAGGREATGFNPYTGAQVTQGVAAVMSPAEIAANRVAQGNLGVAQARLAAELNPAIQEQLAGAKETGKTRAETQIKAAAALPQAIAIANTGIRLIDELVGDKEGHRKPHLGMSAAVGATALPGQRFVPGTDAADFMSRFDQVKDQSFVQAFESLRGGGSITEREGEKATSGLNRMRIATSEAEFIAAARDVQDVYRAGIRRAQQKAGAAPAAATSSAFKGFSATRVP